MHLDIVIVIEQPKILPYRSKIRESIAGAMDIDPKAVSLKAKTAEGIGPIGAGQAAEAHAIATVRKA